MAAQEAKLVIRGGMVVDGNPAGSRSVRRKFCACSAPHQVLSTLPRVKNLRMRRAACNLGSIHDR